MNCDWLLHSTDGSKHCYTCSRCGRLTKPTIYTAKKVRATCRSFPRWHEWGHWAALLLGELGITRRRYVAAKKALGLSPHCKCPQREAAMNHAGDRFRGFVRRIFSW